VRVFYLERMPRETAFLLFLLDFNHMNSLSKMNKYKHLPHLLLKALFVYHWKVLLSLKGLSRAAHSQF
jgi:hypothetical protein